MTSHAAQTLAALVKAAFSLEKDGRLEEAIDMYVRCLVVMAFCRSPSNHATPPILSEFAVTCNSLMVFSALPFTGPAGLLLLGGSFQLVPP